MTTAKARIRIAPDGTLTGRASGLPVGEHDAEIVLINHAAQAGSLDANVLLSRVREIQNEVARLPVVDRRSPDEIVGYNSRGHLD
jgi:hypothetical protein